MFGQNNFLFLSEDSNSVLEQISGKQMLTSHDLDNWQKEFEKRIAHANKYGYCYKFIIIPNKHCVFSEYLPSNLKVSENRPAIHLSQAFPFYVGYPLELLKSIQNSYYKTDTHWTEIGIVNWLNSIAAKLGVPQLDYTINYKEYCGDLGIKVTPNISEIAPFISFTSNSTIKYHNKIKNIGTIKYYQNSNSSLPVGCIFGDSFFNSYCHILSQFFSKLYFFHYWGFDTEIIERIKPDIVWNENIERFISFRRNASFNDVFYEKLFKKNFKHYLNIKNFNNEPDGITSIDYTLASNYIDSINSDFTKENFYKINSDFTKEHRLNCGQPTSYCQPAAEMRFTAWAIGFASEEIIQSNAIRLYLAGLFYNTYLSLMIFDFPKNIKFFNLSGIKPLYVQNYATNNFEIHHNNQMLIFPFLSASKKRIGKQNSHILLVIQGDNYLGIGTRLETFNKIWQNGYYALNYELLFHSINSCSIDWSLIRR